VDHPQAIVAIVYLGVANQQVSSPLFGLIKAPSTNQVDHGVGRGVQGLGLLQREQVFVLLSLHLDALANSGRELCGPVRFKATVLVLLAAAAGAGIVATDL
jgi:hypothetical protein